jgi:hypothetical protein
VLEGHGFFSRAQFQCGFDHYDPQRILDAAECRELVGEKRSKELLSQGFNVFDMEEKRSGRDLWCKTMKKAPAFQK